MNRICVLYLRYLLDDDIQLKSVENETQRGYIAIVFKKHSEFQLSILNICKTNIYSPIFSRSVIKKLIIALLCFNKHSNAKVAKWYRTENYGHKGIEIKIF